MMAVITSDCSCTHMFTIVQHDGPTHLGLFMHAQHGLSSSMMARITSGLFHARTTWTIVQHDGPNHLGTAIKCGGLIRYRNDAYADALALGRFNGPHHW